MRKLIKHEYTKKICKLMIIFIMALIVSGVSLKEDNSLESTGALQVYTPSEDGLTITSTSEENINVDNMSVEEFVEENEETLLFYARIFDMNYEDIVSKINEFNVNNQTVIENNIGYLANENNQLYDFGSVDKGILELCLYLEEVYPDMITYDYEPYTTGNADYVAALIEYFSNVYANVDYKLMLSIAAAESGYFTSSSMLYKNNVYGGMSSSGGLITYKNIEYGVMQYIKKMSEQYYDKGLNTIESIGYVFCPTITGGVKTVSSHWLNLVNQALSVYTDELHYVSVAQLNDLLYYT